MVLLFGTADAIDYLAITGGPSEPGHRLAAGRSIVVLLISLIGGRIIPSFTRNWMAKHGITKGAAEPARSFDLLGDRRDRAGLLAWLTGPSATPIGVVLIAAGVLQAVRWARWRGYRTFADPLVLILHVGYVWIPIGLDLLGQPDGLLPRSAAIHALTAGAMATMILAVMTRASLGHTARELRPGPATILLYALVTIGALLRVAASLKLIDYNLGHRSGRRWPGAAPSCCS